MPDEEMKVVAEEFRVRTGGEVVVFIGAIFIVCHCRDSIQ